MVMFNGSVGGFPKVFLWPKPKFLCTPVVIHHDVMAIIFLIEQMDFPKRASFLDIPKILEAPGAGVSTNRPINHQ